MKEPIYRQIIRLLRDMIAAMRVRDEIARSWKDELHRTGSKLEAVESELDDVKTELTTVKTELTIVKNEVQTIGEQLSQLLSNQNALMNKLIPNGGE